MMVTQAEINELETRALALAELALAFKPKVKEEPRPASDKARRIRGLIKAHFGSGHHKAISHIVAALIDEPLETIMPEKEDEDGPFPRIEGFTTESDGTMTGWAKCAPIVPTANENSHNYEIGEVAFGYKGTTCWRLRTNGEAETGNNMSRKSWRPATPDEVRAAIAKFKPTITGGMFVR